MDNETFGQHLRSLRKEKGLTLKELGEKTGFSYSYLSQLERGERGGSKKRPSLEVLNKIAPVLGVDPLDLMFEAGYISTKFDENQLRDFISSVKKLSDKAKFVRNESRFYIFQLINDAINSIEPTDYEDQKILSKFKDLYDRYHNDEEITVEELAKILPIEWGGYETYGELNNKNILWTLMQLFNEIDKNDETIDRLSLESENCGKIDFYLNNKEITYNGHKLSRSEKYRVLEMLDLMFPQYSENGEDI